MIRRLLLPALLSTSLGGCVATQKDVIELSNQADELKDQIAELKKTVGSMQGNQADLSVQMKQLNESLLSFTEAVKENQGAMANLSSKLDDMGQAVTAKVSAIGTSLSAQQAKNLEEQKAALSQSGPSELFNQADVRLGLKSYEIAAKGFEDYLAQYPKGALADAAAYKLGQSYYGLKKWEKAGQQFAVVLEKHPKSGLTASSRLMYALCLISLKRNLSEARQYLESISVDFPKSPEAKAAADHLKKLKG